jgi:ribonucleoside-triphosphate reductase
MGMKKKFGEYWKNHFSTIGILGMNEACINLFGKDIGTDQGRTFALRVSDFIRHKLLLLQEKTGNNYNFEATPAEGTSYRMARIDKKAYSDIICANEEAYRAGHEPYYTNSSQLPVNYTDDIFEALDLQDEIQTKYTGGTVLHLYAGERVDDHEVIKHLVKKICLGYKIPYFTFSPTFSVCPGHGYLTGNHPQCPDCGETTEVYSRVVGYLRPVAQWNNGKKEEFIQRKSFRIEKAVHPEELVLSQVYKVEAAQSPGTADIIPPSTGSKGETLRQV